MLSQLIHRSYPDMAESDYLAVVDRWLKIKDPDEATAVYEAEVLPRSCYRVSSQAPDASVSLFFVPVGTQPYAPIMTCLGNPAVHTVLLFTNRSKKDALEVQGAFGPTRDFHKIQIDETDPGDIARKVTSAYDVLGQPSDVLCDITGGTKVMTATLAGIAAINGWRQCYVASQYIAPKGSHSEKLVEVPSIFQTMGGWHRVSAWKLASVGQFGEAAKALRTASRESLASAGDQRDLKRFALAQAYRAADFARVTRGATRVAGSFGVSFPSGTVEVLSQGDNRGLLYWVASCLSAEGQGLAASAVLAMLDYDCTVAEVGATLKELAKSHGREWRLKEWKPLEQFLGRAYSKGIPSFG